MKIQTTLFKLIAVLILINYTSCSDSESDEDEDEINKEDNSTINPPEWLIGNWQLNGTIVTAYFGFTEDDIITDTEGSLSGSFSYKEAIEEITSIGDDGDNTVNVTETATSTMYDFEAFLHTSIMEDGETTTFLPNLVIQKISDDLVFFPNAIKKDTMFRIE